MTNDARENLGLLAFAVFFASAMYLHMERSFRPFIEAYLGVYETYLLFIAASVIGLLSTMVIFVLFLGRSGR